MDPVAEGAADLGMRRLVTTIAGVGLGACLAAGVAAAAGFVWFAESIPRSEVQAPRADGIVVLTGGSQRLADGARLLERGLARRLLVSGVNPNTSRGDLLRTIHLPPRLASCCLDLDYEALDTIGNAVETRRWVEEHGFRSLIVVTSAYHMPRALTVMREELPGVALLPYPVFTASLQLDRWWEHPPTTRLLAGEYVKFLLALARRTLVQDRTARVGQSASS